MRIGGEYGNLRVRGQAVPSIPLLPCWLYLMNNIYLRINEYMSISDFSKFVFLMNSIFKLIYNVIFWEIKLMTYKEFFAPIKQLSKDFFS